MSMEFSFNGTDVQVVQNLQNKIDVIGPALAEKMTYLMTKLQAKARANTAILRVRESIRNPRAELEGTSVIGHLTWGGEPTTVSYKGGKPYDLALIFEKGTHPHAINPLGVPLTATGKRSHQTRIIGKHEVLHFLMGGRIQRRLDEYIARNSK